MSKLFSRREKVTTTIGNIWELRISLGSTRFHVKKTRQAPPIIGSRRHTNSFDHHNKEIYFRDESSCLAGLAAASPSCWALLSRCSPVRSTRVDIVRHKNLEQYIIQRGTHLGQSKDLFFLLLLLLLLLQIPALTNDSKTEKCRGWLRSNYNERCAVIEKLPKNEAKGQSSIFA